MKWTNYRSISVDKLNQVEKDLNIILPVDYKDVVLNFNGGYPFPNQFELNNKMEVFNNLVSLDKEEYGNIYEILEDCGVRLNGSLFPFGEDPFGNLICIDYSDNQSIVFWSHEINFNAFVEVSYICKNFAEFIEQLRN